MIRSGQNPPAGDNRAGARPGLPLLLLVGLPLLLGLVASGLALLLERLHLLLELLELHLLSGGVLAFRGLIDLLLELVDLLGRSFFCC